MAAVSMCNSKFNYVLSIEQRRPYARNLNASKTSGECVATLSSWQHKPSAIARY